MRRVVPGLVPLVLLAACQTGAPPPAPAPLAELRAGFPPGGVADTIVIDTVERLPLRAADLVAPDGAVTPASYVNVADRPRFATGQSVAVDPWHGAIPGNSGIPAMALADAQASAAMRSQAQVLAIASTADIPLPDPVAYRHDWQRYHIRLTFGTPPQVETRDIPAPEPPPAPPQRP